VLIVKSLFLLASFVASMAIVSLSTAQAQTQPPRSYGTSVVVIDLGEVFQHHERLKSQLEAHKQEIQQTEAYMRQERKKIENLAEQLKTLKPGTPDYTAKEKTYASMQADLQVQMRQKSRELLEQEAKMRYDAYKEVVEHVGHFAEQYNVQLVIRFNRSAIDPTKPQSVQLGVNRPIVYQRSLDITDHIIASVNRNQPPTNVGQGPQIPNRRR
jgi:Skp family chaperone for outer membrane proteins